jgi:hypothetical protein
LNGLSVCCRILNLGGSGFLYSRLESDVSGGNVEIVASIYIYEVSVVIHFVYEDKTTQLSAVIVSQIVTKRHVLLLFGVGLQEYDGYCDALLSVEENESYVLYCSILLHFFNFSQTTNYTVLCATVYCKFITSSLLK